LPSDKIDNIYINYYLPRPSHILNK
jgi:hypothetical protein